MAFIKTRRKSESGLSLIAAAVFIVVAAIAIAVALPRMQAMRLNSAEQRAVGHLRNIAAREQQFQRAGVVDQDGDTIGEFGLLGEMSGELIPRGAEKALAEPYLDAAFNTGGNAENGSGCAHIDGYIYRIFMPCAISPEGAITAGDDYSLGGSAATAGKPLTDIVAADLQEKHFVCYAWPADSCAQGCRAFAVTEKGIVVGTAMQQLHYSELPAGGNVPAANAVFIGEPFTGELAQDAIANDGNEWSLVP
jgi:hypothetical protein